MPRPPLWLARPAVRPPSPACPSWVLAAAPSRAFSSPPPVGPRPPPPRIPSSPSPASSSARPRPRWLLPSLASLGLLTLGSSTLLLVWSTPPPPPPPSPSFTPPTLPPDPPPDPPTVLQAYLLNPLSVYLLEPALTALRFLHLVGLFLPVLLLCPVAYLGPRQIDEDGRQGERKGAVWWFGLLVGAMQRAGPSFIKLAQWAGSRTDLFPPSLCARFATLHSNGQPHPLAHTVRLVERAFARPFDAVFEAFDEEPMGCGAIAQVYKGVLRSELLPPAYLSPNADEPSTLDEGRGATEPTESPPPTTTTSRTIALKVLHPRVHQTVARDLKIMAFFASLVNLLPGMQWISLPEEVAVFGEMMNQQLDLRVEAANLDRFAHNFAARRGAAVSFPRLVLPVGVEGRTREVLVEEYERAVPLECFLDRGGGEYDPQLANMGLDAFLKMLLLDNFTHGDLHPGNIMVKFYRPTTASLLRSAYNYLLHNLSSSSPSSSTPLAASQSADVVGALLEVKHDQAKWEAKLKELFADGWRPELVFIDAGLVTCLDERNRRNFLDLFQAIAEFDGYRAGQLMVSRCRTPELVLEPEHFALQIQHVVLSVKAKTFTLSAIRISDVLTEVLQAVQRSHVKMEGDFVNTILSILLLEGIGRQLDPQLDLFKSALPILRQVGGRMGASKEAMAGVPANDLGAMLKIWLYLEARQLASNVKVDWDEFIRYDWLTPNL